MNLEICLSSILTFLIVLMAYRRRETFAAACLISLGLFCTGLPLLRATFGGRTWPATDDTLIFAYGGIALYALSIFVVSIALGGPRLDILAGPRIQSTLDSVRWALLILLAMWVIRIYKGATYGIFFSGSGTEEDLRSIPYWFSSVDSIMSLLGEGSLVMLTIAVSRGGSRLLWGIIILEMLWSFSNGGRREVILLSVIVIWIVALNRAIPLQITLAALGVVAFLLYLMTPLFLGIRNANADYLNAGMDPLSALQNAVSDVYAECGIGFDCSDMTRENVVARGNAMEFVKSVVGGSQAGHPLLDGYGTLHSLTWAIPSFIRPKPSMMTEQFIEVNFGLPIGDDAISVPAVAYADAGLLGCVLGGVFVAIFIRIFSRVALMQRSDLLSLSMSYGLVRIIWSIEGDPLSYVVLLRDSIILILLSRTLGRVGHPPRGRGCRSDPKEPPATRIRSLH